jgi:glucose/arabinose dehydrogenase
MQRWIFLLTAALGLPASASAADLPKPMGTGLKNPESVAVASDGKIYLSVIGEFGKDGDGSIVLFENGKFREFVKGLNDPKGLAVFGDALFVADNDRVLRIERKSGQVTLFAPPNAFPVPPLFLNDVAVDPESGMVYVSDSGDLKGNEGAVYKITPKGLVETVVNKKIWPELQTPNGLVLDGAAHLLVGDFATGELHRVKLADRTHEKIADGMEGLDGIAWDHYGRLFVSSWKQGKVWVIGRPGDAPKLLAEGFESAADICLSPDGRSILVPDMKAGTLTAIAAQVPGAEVKNNPLPLATDFAFPNLKWTGWKGETDSGKINPLRPIVLTHFGDGSNRVVVATQHGVIHAFANDQKAEKTEVILDIQDRCRYRDDQNEEGFLGLAFHPKYKENGELYCFYTLRNAKHPHTNVLARFRMNKDRTAADPKSEEILLTVEHPFWNHDGGTVAFGPDGMLYLVLGDGGAANDLYDNAQKKQTLLGRVIRIDVDNKSDGKPYAIPKDNPFVGNKDFQPETWVYGLRNVWRFSFDRKTGQCWGADVGQNLYEEINLFTAGGNYGWNRREGLHPFGARGTGPKKEFIDPIWEYHHDIGRSITGGFVYRGSRVKELEGAYVYADYVSGRIWALRYDAEQKRVVANQPIQSKNLPILSFGEDEQGDVYLLTYNVSGRGIYRFVRSTKE